LPGARQTARQKYVRLDFAAGRKAVPQALSLHNAQRRQTRVAPYAGNHRLYVADGLTVPDQE
jgi:hypothetical protein